MKAQYIMAIDQGTTSSRAVIVDASGQIIASDQLEFRQIYPQAGWVEHDPEEIWQTVQRVMSGAMIDGQLQAEQIAAIGIANQRETTVIWEKRTGRPIYNAIVWQSRQTSDLAEGLVQAGHSQMIHQKTGLIPDAYFSATKIRWILDQVDGAQLAAENGDLLFGTIDSWLVWKLTEGASHVTDVSNASRTMLMNIHSLKWDPDILRLLNIPRAMLPEIRSNSEVYGLTKNYHFFGHEVPITGMAGDQQAALFGHLAFEAGMVKCTYGTGAFIVMNTGQKVHLSKHNLLTTVAYKLGHQVTYAVEGSIFVAGSSIQWLRDQLNFMSAAPDSEAMARQSTSQDEIYVVPAFTGLGAPYWNSDARGSIYGLTRGSSKEDLTKATLQSIAYQVCDVIRSMQDDIEIEIPLLKCDGGASMNDYLMQFQADLLNIPLKRTHRSEMTALGAAYLAGLAVGYWQDLSHLAALKEESDCFQDKMDPERRERLYQGWRRAVKATEYYAELNRSE